MMSNNPKTEQRKFTTLKEFYPFYLTEHQNTTNRFLHFIGIAILCLCFITSMLFHDVRFFAFIPIAAYGFAWIGHQFFEKNKPATFRHPFFSMACDFLFFGDIIMGRQSFIAK